MMLGERGTWVVGAWSAWLTRGERTTPRTVTVGRVTAA